MSVGPGRVWGAQHPYERGHLQRNLALLGLGSVFSVTVVLLVHENVGRVVGIALVGAGAMCALAAVTRHRYVRETQVGFAILGTRDGRFVFGSAAAFVVVALCVTALVAG
jgi:hypothetical protein